jgi:hypothetical protein
VIAQTLAAAVPAGVIPHDRGHFFDLVLLLLHVAGSAAWALCVVLAALIAVPRLRRIPSAVGLHVLQINRRFLASGLWAAYLLSFGTGVWLMYEHAIYRPPWSGSDWSKLRGEPYGVPYYYALYGKVLLFLLAGAASWVLVREAARVAAASETSGGPVEFDPELEDTSWLDDEVVPEGMRDDLGVSGAGPRTTTGSRTNARAGSKTMVARTLPRTTTSPAVLWGAVAVVGVGFGGISFCVTLIKYFHELSKSAVVYQILSR